MTVRSLSSEDVKLIRACKVEKKKLLKQIEQYSDRVLAEKFGVNHRTINRVSTYETYKNVR